MHVKVVSTIIFHHAISLEIMSCLYRLNQHEMAHGNRQGFLSFSILIGMDGAGAKGLGQTLDYLLLFWTFKNDFFFF